MEYKPPLRVRQKADRAYLIDPAGEVVASTTLARAGWFEEIAAQENRRVWGAAILWMLGFTKDNP